MTVFKAIEQQKRKQKSVLDESFKHRGLGFAVGQGLINRGQVIEMKQIPAMFMFSNYARICLIQETKTGHVAQQ